MGQQDTSIGKEIFIDIPCTMHKKSMPTRLSYLIKEW